MEYQWQYYVFTGIFIMILEVFAPTFFLIPIGLGVMVSGVFTLWVSDRSSMYVITALCIIASVIIMRRLIRFPKSSLPTPVESLLGQEIEVESDLKPGLKAFGKIYGESWMLVPEQREQEFNAGERAVIVAVDGNKLIIKKR